MPRIRTIFDKTSDDEEDDTHIRRQIRNLPREELKVRISDSAKRKFLIYILLQVTAIYFGLGMPVFAVGCLYFMVQNTAKTSGIDSSAYSVFNRNQRRIQGDSDADALDRQLRRGGL